jgi:micrococcal nuclease
VPSNIEAELQAYAPVTREAGLNRYATAAAVSKAHFGPGVGVVYIATGTNFPDALAAGPAAAKGGGPVLLVKGNSLPPETAAELQRLGPARIVITGGTSTILPGVQNAIVRTMLEPTGPTQTGTVTRVIDGDTIEVNIGGVIYDVRYIGMDTPEIYSGVEWLGPEASAANAAMVAGKQVVLEKDVSETDQYGRLLRYVWVQSGGGWLLVNLELLRMGLATVTTYPPDVKYVDWLYLPAQREAQAAGLGLWGTPPAPPTPPPPSGGCDPSYPTVCIPPPPPDLDCPQISFRNFVVRAPDPHGFDGDHDGVGCET